jgi:peptidoglycan/xylan/chitin deacetylase (PgdA/CDA1 family)
MIARVAKRLVKKSIASPLGWRLLGPRLRAPGVIVLTYHRIRAPNDTLPGISFAAFAEQMRWVRERCEPIEPEALKDAAARPPAARPPVLVTFDDGYRDYHDLAYPLLKELGIPAVVFLSTKLIDDGSALWTDEIDSAVLRSARSRVKLPWDDGPPIARADVARVARRRLKAMPDSERRSAVAALLAELDAPPITERQMLSWDEVRRTMDHTRYGGHSHTHAILSRLDAAAVEREIATCKERIEKETRQAPTLFAYPNGRPEDYTIETKDILRRHGFSVAFSTTEGIAGPDSDWLAVKRLPSGEVGAADFAWIAAGLMR